MPHGKPTARIAVTDHWLAKSSVAGERPRFTAALIELGAAIVEGGKL